MNFSVSELGSLIFWTTSSGASLIINQLFSISGYQTLILKLK
jgi:hypothetical protein